MDGHEPISSGAQLHQPVVQFNLVIAGDTSETFAGFPTPCQFS